MKRKLLAFVLLPVLGLAQEKKDSLDGQKDKLKLKEVVAVGSRSNNRTNTNTPVPIDVFDIEKQSVLLPQTNINQVLNSIAPSFTSTVQTIADGTDHLDPAQLRGLGPDQTLVLIEGKRRHSSALVNINGSPGRGSVGTDLNAIPAYALRRIEVLRDGASAQYGSDAIAGVINLRLKKATKKLQGQVSYGANLGTATNDHTGGIDGNKVQLDLNYGNTIGNNGGFYNLTWSSQVRGKTSRADAEQGNIFNAYNAIENRARKANVDLSSYFQNINTTSQGNELINQVKKYASEVPYFSSSFLGQIQSANSISDLQTILKEDFTDQELQARGLTRKDFNMQVGQSALSNHQFFANVSIPFYDDWKFYTFGGYSYRQGESGGFYRRPNQSRTFTAVYPNGFLPKIGTTIQDLSNTTGIKTQFSNGWNFDLSNTYGKSNFKYTIKNTSNTSLRYKSPTEFDAGTLGFIQNTTNIDLDKDFDLFEGLNFAVGAEHRFENYLITPGEPLSFLSYDINGNPQTSTTPNDQKPTDFFGSILPGGSQVFSGFTEDSRTNETRRSIGVYAEAGIDFTRRLLVDAAVRYENYSDFGSTFNYKIASRIKLDKNINFRFAGSTGFRAPSIHQIYYNNVTTLFAAGELLKVGTFRNDSQIAELLGIPKLKQETSKSVSSGFVWTAPQWGLMLTADAYLIRINNRIVLTDSFRPFGTPENTSQQQINDIFSNTGSNAAQFFANAINTETKGLDIVISHRKRIGDWRLENNFAINLNKTRKVGDVKASSVLEKAGLVDKYFSEKSRVYAEEAFPRIKAALSHNFTYKDWQLYLINTYFGEVTGAGIYDINKDGKVDFDEHPVYGAKVITDLTVRKKITEAFSLTVGANNLFDIYPGKNDPTQNLNGQFIYTRSTSQFGLNGRYLFARVDFSF